MQFVESNSNELYQIHVMIHIRPKACPFMRAVKFATISELFIPFVSILFTNNKFGLSSFSNTVHVQLEPNPEF